MSAQTVEQFPPGPMTIRQLRTALSGDELDRFENGLADAPPSDLADFVAGWQRSLVLRHVPGVEEAFEQAFTGPGMDLEELYALGE
ncbi:hypothetical protein [Kitasatospora sp. NPDC002040]|uniref:hypothetical protein n=1 Tax=Kitasatospora sp. NPDC002040 TaxID=3154661 RepID=UPI00331AC147